MINDMKEYETNSFQSSVDLDGTRVSSLIVMMASIDSSVFSEQP